SCQRAIESIAVPCDTGGNHFVEAQLPAKLRHVEIDTRRHEHQMVPRLAMTADGGEGIAEATVLDGVAHELRAGRGELVARDPAQSGAQQRLLERAAVVIE